MSLSWPRVHLIAARAASRVHRDLRIDTTRQIDPFAALDAAGVLVVRRRLDHLAGLYLPADLHDPDAVPSVLINVAHPASKQRFTAAHELGHHARDKNVSLDRDTEWLARGDAQGAERERLAEAFAAWFLMPQRLVLRLLADLGFQADTLDADGAYALSLALGTSYTATVRHLADMQEISTQRSEHLLRITPQTIKQEIGGLDVAANSWKDIHRLAVTQEEVRVTAQEGDVLLIDAPETPSSGYLWAVRTPADGVALIRDEYRAYDPDALGGRGQHRFLFRMEEAGEWDMVLELRRPWQHAAVDTARVVVIVYPQPAPGIVHPNLLVRDAA